MLRVNTVKMTNAMELTVFAPKDVKKDGTRCIPMEHVIKNVTLTVLTCHAIRTMELV